MIRRYPRLFAAFCALGGLALAILAGWALGLL